MLRLCRLALEPRCVAQHALDLRPLCPLAADERGEYRVVIGRYLHEPLLIIPLRLAELFLERDITLLSDVLHCLFRRCWARPSLPETLEHLGLEPLPRLLFRE
jgi:hypothetical protein